MVTTHTRRGVLSAATAATAALAGCNVLPEQDNEPVVATAETPAALPESDEYTLLSAENVTVETTIDVDLTGDVQISSQQDVTATVFRRVYEAGDGQRFGVLTSPAVTVVDQPEIVRDPLTGLKTARVLGLATNYDVESVEGWRTDGSVTLLGTETTHNRTTGAAGGTDTTFVMARVRAGDDSVTAIATDPDNWTPPFGAVERDA
jgi:hypothetical protein